MLSEDDRPGNGNLEAVVSEKSVLMVSTDIPRR